AWIGGPFIVGVALIFAGWAVRTMRAGGASIPTGEPTDVIVQDGPYRYSRNPIYLAMVMSLVGTGVWANSLWFVGLAIVTGALLSWGAISREEAYLQRKFGDRYSAYKASVRRWM
ncbi:MAG: isoprenylcysteine carboxylmethyltransferase family protein, partial [Rhodospirillaceae bacterium]|nr:isoprenylcysteine carboxylmethyltransferase family protein [Rhodospirillaceae bacterium]